jgi:hypothetical protein
LPLNLGKIMALEKTVTTVQALVAVNAYHRVENIQLESKTNMSFSLRSYVSSDKPFFAEELIKCAYDMDGNNLFKQAYSYVKTLEAFKDSKDC